MCEFCLFTRGGVKNHTSNRDAHQIEFAGFFSAAAIDAAVRQANANRRTGNLSHSTSSSDEDDGSVGDDDGDSDGT